MIEIQNISKLYGKKQNIFAALSDVSLTIPDATSVAITGKSGSGKSTLMHIVSGLDHATKGKVIVNGKDLQKLKRKEMDKFRSKEMGFIFQSFFVEANRSCLDNVLLPLEIAGVPRSKRRKLAEEALESVELTDKKSELAKNLSGGQKQRLAIARAIVNKPKVIFADEPTGNLDTATGDLVTRLLFNLQKQLGATLIIVTHDEDLSKLCQIKVVLKDGKIISENKEGGKK